MTGLMWCDVFSSYLKLKLMYGTVILRLAMDLLVYCLDPRVKPEDDEREEMVAIVSSFPRKRESIIGNLGLSKLSLLRVRDSFWQ